MLLKQLQRSPRSRKPKLGKQQACSDATSASAPAASQVPDSSQTPSQPTASPLPASQPSVSSPSAGPHCQGMEPVANTASEQPSEGREDGMSPDQDTHRLEPNLQHRMANHSPTSPLPAHTALDDQESAPGAACVLLLPQPLMLPKEQMQFS